MTNEELYNLCVRFGVEALAARRKFAGLLPEVFRRGLHRRKGFGSIYEFAAKLAGMSREQVDLVLRLDKRFEDKPILRKALREGDVSVNKLKKIAPMVTIENQEEMIVVAESLPCRALETFVRDGQKSGHVTTFEMADDVRKALAELAGKGIDVNEFLREALRQRELEIESEKKNLQDLPATSKHIPVQIRELVHREHGTKCSVPGCFRNAAELHHTRRFSIVKSHDPRYLAPMCKEHHQIAHSIDSIVCRARAGP